MPQGLPQLLLSDLQWWSQCSMKELAQAKHLQQNKDRGTNEMLLLLEAIDDKSEAIHLTLKQDWGNDQYSYTRL